MQLEWIKCKDSSFFDFMNGDLSQSHFDGLEGIYIIWHRGSPSKVVRLGQGNIRERLTAHRQDAAIMKYKHLGMSVIWAQVDSRSRDGIEHYLGDILKPLEGDRFPNAPVIPVNLPW